MSTIEILLLALSCAELVALIVLIVIITIKKPSQSINGNQLNEKALGKTIDESVGRLQSFVTDNLEKTGQNTEKEIQRRFDIIENQLQSFEKDIKTIEENSEKELHRQLTDADSKNRADIQELKTSIESFKESTSNEIKELIKDCKAALDEVGQGTQKLIQAQLESFKELTNQNLTNIKDMISTSLDTMSKENEKHLSEINEAVNSKLEKTINQNLQSSFDALLKQINNVNQTIGEIKSIQGDVTSLRNTLTNIKTKGIVGEVILGNLIEDILTPDQYVKDYRPNPNSIERVEYAIKMPGSKDDFIYLPIDSKFPTEDYNSIKEAMDNGDKEQLEKARKRLKTKIVQFAGEIRKYINVPYTTDFAIMFLPTESLYSEVASLGVIEELQKEQKIVIVSPTVLQAVLNALQMGFKSIAIERKSEEVANLLINVRKEFSKFADCLDATQKTIDKASENLSTLVTTRTHKLKIQLDKVDQIGYSDDTYETEE